MTSCYYVVFMDETYRKEYTVHAKSSQEAADKVRKDQEINGNVGNVIRVSLAQTDWY